MKVYLEIIHQMRITEVARRCGMSTDQIRYLERKGFIQVDRVQVKKRSVRDYSENDLHRIELIGKYLEQGFKIDVAYQKAMDEIERPRLL